jgi:uncharacterized protein (DUF2267 family)
VIYEVFIDEVRRQAGPMPRDEVERIAGVYVEALDERLSGEACSNLAVHLPDRLAARLR